MRELITLIANLMGRLPDYSDASVVTDLAAKAFDVGYR